MIRTSEDPGIGPASVEIWQPQVKPYALPELSERIRALEAQVAAMRLEAIEQRITIIEIRTGWAMWLYDVWFRIQKRWRGR